MHRSLLLSLLFPALFLVLPACSVGDDDDSTGDDDDSTGDDDDSTPWTRNNELPQGAPPLPEPVCDAAPVDEESLGGVFGYQESLPTSDLIPVVYASGSGPGGSIYDLEGEMVGGLGDPEGLLDHEVLEATSGLQFWGVSRGNETYDTRGGLLTRADGSVVAQSWGEANLGGGELPQLGWQVSAPVDGECPVLDGADCYEGRLRVPVLFQHGDSQVWLYQGGSADIDGFRVTVGRAERGTKTLPTADKCAYSFSYSIIALAE